MYIIACPEASDSAPGNSIAGNHSTAHIGNCKRTLAVIR